MSLLDRPFETLVLRETEQSVLEVRLCRPDRLNAINAAMLTELIAVFEGLNDDRHFRVAIVTGEGRAFCSGADLLEPAMPGAIPGSAGMGELGFVYRFQEFLGRAILAIHECDKPVIAAINGIAIGGGLGFALACDIRLAASCAGLGAIALKAGLSNCDVGTSYLLPRMVGAGVASELMLTGRTIDASEAREIGLVNRILAADGLAPAALDLARALLENPEYGVWMTKKGLRAALDAPSLRHAMEMENRTQVLGCFTGAMDAMRRAFAQGAKPEWPRL